MWKNLLWNKNGKRQISQLVKQCRGFQTQKIMLEARDSIDQEIRLEPRCGYSSISFDDWTKLGALYFYIPFSHRFNYDVQEVKQQYQKRSWNEDIMTQLFPEEVSQHSYKEILVMNEYGECYYAWQIKNGTGKFNVASAQEMDR